MIESYENRIDHLPPELAAAGREFDAWSQEQLLAEQDDSTPKEPLYHYTDEAALKGISPTSGSGVSVICTSGTKRNSNIRSRLRGG
jgi:hypothetical protein